MTNEQERPKLTRWEQFVMAIWMIIIVIGVLWWLDVGFMHANSREYVSNMPIWKQILAYTVFNPIITIATFYIRWID